MRGLIGVALLFVLFGAVHGSRNHFAKGQARGIRGLHRDETIAKRQPSNCTFPDDYPEKCETAIRNAVEALGSEDVNLDNLRNDLDTFCTTECVQPFVDYGNCLKEPSQVAKYNNLFCGKDGDEYCAVVLVEKDLQESLECVPPGGTCNDASCASKQETVVKEWGCCAASYYASEEITCEDVGAGDQCDGVVDAGIVNRVGLGLIAIFAMIAASANAALF